MSEQKTLKSYEPAPLAGAKQISAGYDEPVAERQSISAPAATPFPRSTSSRMGGEEGGGGGGVPFEVSLFIDGATIEVESGGWGYVVERVPGLFDAVAYHEPSNKFDGLDPRRFAIAVGQALYVRVEVDADGKVGGAASTPPIDPSVTFVVLTDEPEPASSHYTPKVDDTTPLGSVGFYLYKLASLVAGASPGDDPVLRKWLSGSHINHWQELPSIKSTLAAGVGVGVIPQKWDDAEKCYRLRPVVEKAPVAASPGIAAEEVQIHIEQTADSIIAKGNSKQRKVYYTVGNGSQIDVAFFDDGLETLGEPQGNETGNDLTIRTLEVNVIRGLTREQNGLDGGRLDVIGMPDGAPGDMLYFNGTDWVLVPAPPAPSGTQINILTHNGTLPAWETKTIISLGYCDSGTPATGNFIKL